MTHSFLVLSEIYEVAQKVQLQLLSPNVVVDQYGNKGHWTMIYNQVYFERYQNSDD